MPSVKSFKARIYGMVQGVGFRFSTVSMARRVGVSGYVKNMADGSVEVVAEGSADSCERLLAWLKKGPPGAYVRDVSVQETNYNGLYRGFTVEY